MKAIFSKKEAVLLIGLAVIVLLSSLSTVFLGLQLNKADQVIDGSSVDPNREVTLQDIKKTETSYAKKDFSDKIKDGVLSIADCGAEANTLYDYGDLIRSAFITVFNNPGTVLEFEESVYYVSPESEESDCCFDFSEYEVQGLHVKGNGCTIVLLDSLWGAFDLANSRDVVFENMKFDCLVNPFIQGEVTAYDNNANLLTLKTDRPYTIFDDPRINDRITSSIGIIRRKEDPTLIKTNANNYFSIVSFRKLGEQEYQFTLSESTKYLTNSKIEVGDKITINSRSNGSTFIFNVGRNSGFTLKDILIYNSPGGGVGGGQLSGDVVLQNVRMIPHPDSGNWICGSADGVHLQSNSGKVTMENCLFSNLIDDGMNLYQWEAPVNKVVSSTVIEIGSLVIMPKVGDTIEVVERASQRIIGTSKIKEFLPVEGKRIDTVAQAVLETPISGMQTGDVKDTYFYYIKDNSFVGTTVKNTTFQNIRGRGLVLCTTDTVVEDCKFTNLSNQVMQAWYGRGEGFEVQNLTFRNNTIENCNYLLMHADDGLTGQIDIAMHDALMKQSPYISHNNITIADNQFFDYHGCAISIKNARNVTVENNFFDLKKQNYPYKKNNAIYMNISEDITIRNNVFNDDSKNLTAAIRYEASTVKNLTVSDNTYACDKQHEIVKE